MPCFNYFYFFTFLWIGGDLTVACYILNSITEESSQYPHKAELNVK